MHPSTPLQGIHRVLEATDDDCIQSRHFLRPNVGYGITSSWSFGCHKFHALDVLHKPMQATDNVYTLFNRLV